MAKIKILSSAIKYFIIILDIGYQDFTTFNRILLHVKFVRFQPELMANED